MSSRAGRRTLMRENIARLLLLLGTLTLSGCGESSAPPPEGAVRVPRMDRAGNLTIWWDEVPQEVLTVTSPSSESNILRADYVGPDACRKCHPQNHADWSEHPHRWMNALADEHTVLGDFSGASISYLGGTATFEQSGPLRRMRLERDGETRHYEVTQTIGRRFFQYYVGRMVSGPEPSHSPLYSAEHVLPFGYWLDEGEWVPVVHIDDELPDGERLDPFRTDSIAANFRPYAVQCNYCHTTFPLADMMVRATHTIGRHSPQPMHLWTSALLEREHPDIWNGEQAASALADLEMMNVMQRMIALEAPEHAVTLGVSCEACHLGSREHAAGLRQKPSFFPLAAELHVGGPVETGRSRENLNWACGRCHTGHRPQFAAGMATWNSTEFDDMMRGACTTEIMCIHCHDPHQGTGPMWTRTAEQDDASCLVCHTRLEDVTARLAHTHHPPGSDGDRCLNCHMPRLNEGLQDVVRTHMIFSPTNRAMLEAGQPNACNMCHADRPIDWAVKAMSDWYGAEFSETAIAAAYPRRNDAASLNWLRHDHESVRLVAADVLARTDSKFALGELIEALDDPYLINRQFAQRGIEHMLDMQLEEFGYSFYMQSAERREALHRLRQKLAIADPDVPDDR